MEHRLAAVAVFLALALLAAGCLGSDTGGPERNATDDPPDDLDHPPGVNASGIQDLDALYSAHRAALGDAYRENASDTSATPNGSQRVVRDTHRGPNGSIYVHAIQYRDGEPVRVQEIWDGAENQTRLVRLAKPGSDPLAGSYRREYRGPNASQYYDDHTGQARQLLASYLDDANQSVTATERGGRWFWNVTVDAGSGTRFLLLVAPSGHVRTFVLDERRPDRRTRWVIVTEPIDALEEPPWLAKAQTQAPPIEEFGGNGSTAENGTENGTGGATGDASA